MSEATSDDRLDSWKAIARYLGRSVRTVRRWEQLEGLPVHRLMHQAQASVYAFRRELDDWRDTRALTPAESAWTQGTASVSTDAAARASRRPQAAAALAVLPFRFSGPDRSQAWVADGLTEEIIGEFSRLSGLRVTSRTSSLAFKDSDQDSKAIAELLGVGHLLEGSVVGDGERLRINVRLIDPQRDDQVWSQKFADGMDRIFEIQEQIARDVVDALKLELEPKEKAGIGRTDIDHLSAWRRVILARQIAFQWRPDALTRAGALLLEAHKIAGENATICATMGRVLLHHVEAGTADRRQVLDQARTWEARARGADPEHPETRILSAWLAHVSGHLGRAIDELELALQSDHDHPDALVLLAHCLLRVGLIDQARPVIEHAVAVDPLTPLTRCLPGYLAAMEGRFEDAVVPYLDMLNNDPANPVARLFTVWVQLGAEDRDGASDTLQGFSGAAQDSTPAHIARHLVFADRGTIGELVLPEPIQSAARASEMYCRYLAEVWALAGEADRAADWLDRAIDLGFINWPYLSQHSPFLRPLADHPALAPALARARGAWERLREARSGDDPDLRNDG